MTQGPGDVAAGAPDLRKGEGVALGCSQSAWAGGGRWSSCYGFFKESRRKGQGEFSSQHNGVLSGSYSCSRPCSACRRFGPCRCQEPGGGRGALRPSHRSPWESRGSSAHGAAGAAWGLARPAVKELGRGTAPRRGSPQQVLSDVPVDNCVPVCLPGMQALTLRGAPCLREALRVEGGPSAWGPQASQDFGCSWSSEPIEVLKAVNRVVSVACAGGPWALGLGVWWWPVPGDLRVTFQRDGGGATVWWRRPGLRFMNAGGFSTQFLFLNRMLLLIFF